MTSTQMSESKEQWRNRKIETRRMRVGDVLPNPRNPKLHPDEQLAPLRDLLGTIGKLDDLKAYYSERAGGHLVFFDGHGRQELDPDETWDVDIYDLTDEEADLALMTFDPVARLARANQQRLDELYASIQQAPPFEMPESIDHLLASVTQLDAQSASQVKAERDATTGAVLGDGLQFRVIVMCESEQQQSTLLERFESEGLQCQALIS